MTREEATKVLEYTLECVDEETPKGADEAEAIPMAIEALSEKTSTIQEKHQLSEETPTNTSTKPTNTSTKSTNISTDASADRQKGEWIDEDGTYYANCSKCGYQMDTHQERGYFRYCPNCGSDNRGENDYERAIGQIEHDTLYESTYNPEDGSM